MITLAELLRRSVSFSRRARGLQILAQLIEEERTKRLGCLSRWCSVRRSSRRYSGETAACRKAVKGTAGRYPTSRRALYEARRIVESWGC